MAEEKESEGEKESEAARDTKRVLGSNFEAPKSPYFL